MKLLIKRLLTLLAFSYFITTGVNAQVTSLSISPPLIETIIKPGKSILIAYTISNHGDPVILKPHISSLEIKENGKIVFKEAESPVRFSLDNSDLALEQPFFLKTAGRQQLLLRIRIPEGAPEGDYYHSLVVESQPPPLIEGVSSTRNKVSISSNILITTTQTGNLNLNGKIIRFESLPRFKLNLFGKRINIFDSNDKIPLLLILKNTGKNFFQPQGEINLQGNFGERAKYDLVPVNILANSQRLIPATPSAEINSPQTNSLTLMGFFVGRYQLSTTIKLGNAKLLYAHTDFIALPFRFLIAFLFISVITFLIIRQQRH
jgi:hypothetical protein